MAGITSGEGSLPDPEAGAGQVLVALRRAGEPPGCAHHQNRYDSRHPRSFAPSGEVVDVMSPVGLGVTEVNVGDRVANVAVDRCISMRDSMSFAASAVMSRRTTGPARF
ncbi:zinc-binding alcohol dehydrogenase family protein [Bradyrhizobium sp. 166]|uniref:hypothetical protein n=1 Tax=Bradyrhizobium sp. 166 TaxID=2782638 RepID=UPI001FF8E0D0|nr:hypothetical protein [Bradyrhizobium sp. 166]MCK1600486.1 zinc-binding alcohol dehydrogenase family protein [Bradyrhizobium sp. 166]